MTTTREVTATGLGAKAVIEWSDTDRRKKGLEPAKSEVKAIRERWAALTDLNQDIQNAGRTLKQLQWFSLWQTSLPHLMVALAAIAVTLIAVWWYVPTVAQMTALRAEHAQLEASIEDLHNRDARIELNTCGSAKRLCVLVDTIAGQFGDPKREKVYMIAKGYF